MHPATGTAHVRTSWGFRLSAATFALFLFASSAPSPLYPVYQQRFAFSASTLTAVFAVYAATLLVALLLTGSLSDSVGRRPVILVGLAVQVLAMAAFLAADGLAWLYAARILQGVATGLVTGALSAALVDLQPPGSGHGPLLNSVAPGAGLALGSLVTGALVQYGPAPLRLVFALLLAAFVVVAVATARSPESVRETVPLRLRALRPRVGVERQVRRAFLAAVPCLVALWALSGFYLSLGSSLVALLLHDRNHAIAGAFLFLLTGLAALASLLGRGLAPVTGMLAGCAALSAGAAVTVVGVAVSSPVLLFLGTAAAGVGFGLGFLGALRTLTALAAPEQRGAVLATVYIVSYLAFSVPALAAGLAATHVGLHATALGYGAAVAVLAAAAVGLTLLLRHAPPPIDLTPYGPIVSP